MVHLYKAGGYNIVLDVESGAVHIVDDAAYELIPLMESVVSKTADSPLPLQTALDRLAQIRDEEALKRFCDEELREAVEEICELADAGALYSPDVYEQYVSEFSKHRATVVKALCLHMAHDCNLSCEYCFAGEGVYKGERALMSYEVGKKALDFLIENSGSRRNLEVDFFGGEPLMNWQVVKDLVQYGRSREKEAGKNFRFTLTTNGVLLNDEIIEFANKEMANVVCSIDGRKEIHDKKRPLRGGQGSYDIILPKFKKVATSREQNNYYVRGTYTHDNTDFSEDVIHLMDEGFEQISVEPVVAGPEESYAIRDEDIPELLKQYDLLAQEIIKRRRKGEFVNFFHFMIDLEQGPCVAKRLSGCGAGSEYLAVTPQGELYPCHQFVGNEEFKMGDVYGGIERQDIKEKFLSCNVYTKEKCRDCFAKFYCSGGCMANAYNFTGDVNGNYETGCILQRKRIECAIMIKAALADQEAEA
ncbi:MAG: thioether cross-link-forming SCIFF peptide maturase [Lachnospiraceae bacterium]|nr:thioether cross-link-forming SCIFF peptide maturase [Lachnospiraceae bacterium]